MCEESCKENIICCRDCEKWVNVDDDMLCV